MRTRVLTVLSLVAAMLVVGTPPARATGDCIHIDVKIYADGALLSDGARIASDGGFGHAGTGQTFTFVAKTFPAAPEDCELSTRDRPVWQVITWPCEDRPKPRTGPSALSWRVRVPVGCRVTASPALLSVSITNGRASAGNHVMIYAGSPGWSLPHKQARGLFGPFAVLADPVNTLTGALTMAETDAAMPAVGIPLTVARAYNSDDPSSGPLGPGWRASYTDRLVVGNGAVYHAADGREVAFSRRGSRYVAEPGPARLSLHRDPTGFVLTTTDRVRMLFSPAGRLTRVVDRNGQGVRVHHVDGRLASVSNARRSLRYGYQGDRIVSVTMTAPGERPRTVRYSYEGGRLDSVLSPGGLPVRYGYDAAGRLSTVSTGDRSGPELTTNYDPDGRVEEQIDGNGRKTTWSWDSAGSTDSGTSTMTDPAGGRWTNVYERGWLVEQVDPTGAAVRFHYDAAGNLIRVFDALGNGARHAYDALGRVVSSTNAAGHVTRRGYAADLAVIADPLGRRTTFAYDKRGNRTSTSYAGTTSAAWYDRRGLITAVRDPLGRTTRFGYSADGDLVRSVDPVGRLTAYRVDGWGRTVAVLPPRGGSRLEYDADDRLVGQVGPLGVRTAQSYDGRGRLATVTDGLGRVTRFRYDDAGQLAGVQRPSSPEATFDYDPAGRVVRRVDPGGRGQTFAYDAAGRMTSTSYGGRVWRFGYDRAGRLVRTTLPSGKSASYELDPRGFVVRVRYSDRTPPVAFSWDPVGRRSSMVDAAGTTRFGYDAFDRLVSAGAVRYRWDAGGNLLSRSAGGRVESFTWDAVDRLTSVRLDGRPVASYAFGTDRVTARRADGVAEVRRFDARDRLVALAVQRSGRTVRTVSADYDSADNLVRTQDSVSGATSYGYDSLGRLTEVCYSVTDCADYIQYGYDGSGNRIFERRPSGTTWSAYGPGSELLGTLTMPSRHPLEPPRARVFSYDADGNLASDGQGRDTLWNAAGKPVLSTLAGVRTSYVHGGDGRRFAERTGDATVRYQWDPLSPQLLGVGSTRFVYGDGLLASATDGRTTQLATDLTGSVGGSFEPYGVARGAETASSRPAGPGFAGGLRLPNGNYLLGQREYDPRVGVFLSPDQGGSDQAYGYASGNPIAFSDLTGMDDIDARLARVSTITGYISTGALAVAAGCTVFVICAPAVPFALGVSGVTGIASGITAGALDAKICTAKGNCSGAIAGITVTAFAGRFRGLTGVRSGAKLSGRTVFGDKYDDEAIRAARNADREPGFFDAIGHGTPTSVYDELGQELSPKELATHIRSTPSWNGQSVRLMACRTGACPTGFAQQLADELGVTVKAPTERFLVDSRGKIKDDPGGTWLLFYPR